MRPVDFEESNKNLAPPSDLPEGVECGSLPIWTDGQQCVSVWELEGDEIVKLCESGRVYVTVLSGKTQPPLELLVESPFVVKEPDDAQA